MTTGSDPTKLEMRSQANQQCYPDHFLMSNFIRTSVKADQQRQPSDVGQLGLWVPSTLLPLNHDYP